MTEAAAAGALLAFVTSATLTGVIAATGPIDTVKARSSHRRPTPTGAGLALLSGAAAGAALGPASPTLAVLMACAAGLGVFGAADDLLDLGAGPKLLAQAVAAALVAVLVASVTSLPFAPGTTVELGPWFGAAGSALFLLVLVNAFNFMDGSDGLVSGASAVSAAGLAAAGALFDAPLVIATALALSAAALGFLPWNLRRRVFQGDVGAFFAALLIGGLGLMLSAGGATTPYFVVFTALPLITDVLLTLVVRARRRESLFQAHRDHLYQLWLRTTSRSHLELAARVWALTALSTAAGLLFELYARDWAFTGLLATAALLSAGWVRLRARLSSALPRTSAAGAPRAGRPADPAGTDTPPNR